MRKSLLAVFLFLTACAATPQTSAVVDLPATFSNGSVFVKVSVNGAPEVWMQLDNGTTPSAIDLDYARSLGLDLRPGAGSGTGIGSGTFSFYNTSAYLTAGAASRHIGFAAVALQGMAGPDGKPLAGVLGYSFLAGQIAVIDYPAQRLSFVASLPPCGCDIAMKLDTDIPAIPVSVAGHRLTALVDTGGAYDLLLAPRGVAAAALEAEADGARASSGYGYAGPQAVKVGQAPDVTVGEVTKPQPQALFATFGTSPLKAEAALGSEFLKAYRVTLNYRGHTVRIEP